MGLGQEVAPGGHVRNLGLAQDLDQGQLVVQVMHLDHIPKHHPDQEVDLGLKVDRSGHRGQDLVPKVDQIEQVRGLDHVLKVVQKELDQDHVPKVDQTELGRDLVPKVDLLKPGLDRVPKVDLRELGQDHDLRVVLGENQDHDHVLKVVLSERLDLDPGPIEAQDQRAGHLELRDRDHVPEVALPEHPDQDLDPVPGPGLILKVVL